MRKPDEVGCIQCDGARPRQLAIHTSMGWRTADPYDMVVQGSNGIEPCAPVIFFELYEPDGR